MFLGKISRRRHTVAFRLTFWYWGIFTVSSLAAFLICFVLGTSGMTEYRDQSLLRELAEFSSLLGSEGMGGVKSAILHETESAGVGDMFIRIMSPTGDLLASSNTSSWGNIGISKAALERIKTGAIYVFETSPIWGYERDARVLYGGIGPDKILQIGESMEIDERFKKVFGTVFGTTMAGLMVFAAFTGWFMARRALLGVEEVTRTALRVAKGAFGQRVQVKAKGEEIGKLTITFNGMLDRIDALISGMREMSDNIAHELRSPLARIRGVAEMTLNAGKSMNDYEEMAANTIDECDRLLEMINTMLDISEAEAGASKLTLEEIDVASVVRDACDLYQPLAEGKGVLIISRISGSHPICGDIRRLQRLVVNLLDNAVKYTSPGGTVTVSVDEQQGQMVFSVEDTGVGISEDDLPHIFRRFYRCDRSRSEAGFGLGLSLAEAIARTHGGKMTATSVLGKGSRFTVILPRRSLSE
jgi:signal transduction histidine kinase